MLDSPLIDKFYNNVKQIKDKIAVKKGGHNGYTESLYIFSKYIHDINKYNKNKNYINSLINYIYSQNLDIMFLYEVAIAANNNNDKNATLQIALLKWHTRHNINNVSNEGEVSSTTSIEDLRDVI